MPATLIADDLQIRTRVSQTGPLRYMGVEYSQPVFVLGGEVVAVSGEVTALSQTGTTACRLELQASIDRQVWSKIASLTLPTSPAPFALAPVAVATWFVRVRWVISDPTAASYWQVSATLNSGEG